MFFFATGWPQTRIPGYLSLFAPNCQANAEACETTGLSGAAAPGRGLDAEAAAAGLCLCYGVGAMAFKNDQRGRGGGAKVIHMDTYGIYLDIYIILYTHITV